MARRTKNDKNSRPKGRASRRRFGLGPLRFGRALLIGGTLLSVGLGVFCGRTVARLDRIVTARFEGRLFRVPSRVYAAPTILYPGLNIDRVGLLGSLERLGYRREEDPALPLPGSYRWDRARLDLHLRAFEHPTRSERARRVSLELDGRTLAAIRSLPSGRDVSAVLVEPEPVGAFFGPNREQRDLVRLGDLPNSLLAAVLAVEDQRFESHKGIDWRRVGGAFLANVRAGGIREGGSTLTQQLVKNFFLTPERKLRRKAQEAVMALLVEARYDKGAILEAYLNEIYFGQRGSTAIHGVGEASRAMFGKSARDLSLSESALIAALIQGPNRNSPYRNPERALKRRNLVLQLMAHQGRISDNELQTALEQPIRLAAVAQEPRDARYFLDALRRELPNHYDPETLASEGIRIYATLDLSLQHRATEVLRDGLDNLEKTFGDAIGENSLQGCLIALRPQTGEILALVGGRDYGRSQFDRCTQARRPAGSVFKPFVYVAALEKANGPVITLASTLDDSPLTIDTDTGPWSPENYDREFHGQVGVREALERSFNVATARLAQEVGIEQVADMAARLGIESGLPRVPSLALGAADLSPLETARAYATLANGGMRPELRFFEDVVDAKQETLERRPLRFERVIDPATAFLAVTLLEGVVDSGTARALRRNLRGPVAGKTGTSDDSRDVWFVGFTPELVAVVWVGFDEPQSLGGAASQIALPIWAKFMQAATGGVVRGAFTPPAGIEEIEIDPLTGSRALFGCPRRKIEYFAVGTAPRASCPESPWFDPRGRDHPARGVIERLFDRWLRGSPR